ncbi:MAG: DUF3592 domain-containing protein [Planctomycetes bacterium]|nr:DUF3592 domain-containing protein [Planctomycetota bacterium]
MNLWQQMRAYPSLHAGLLLALFGTGGVIAGLLAEWHWGAFRDRGVRVWADLQDFSWDTSFDVYEYRYEFSANGRRYGGKDSSERHNLESGRRIQIVYDPDDPTRSELAENVDAAWWVARLFVPLFGSLAVPGWWITAVCMIRARREHWLARHGDRARGRIVAVQRTKHVTLGDRHPQFLRYRFRGTDGKVRTGESRYLPRRMDGQFSVGDEVPVFYDPNAPDRHTAGLFGAATQTSSNARSAGAVRLIGNRSPK